MMTNKGGFRADWWVTCGNCGETTWIDYPQAGATKRICAVRIGYRYDRARGWLCPVCSAQRTADDVAYIKSLGGDDNE